MFVAQMERQVNLGVGFIFFNIRFREHCREPQSGAIYAHLGTYVSMMNDIPAVQQNKSTISEVSAR